LVQHAMKISYVLPIWINLRDDRNWERDLDNALMMLDAQTVRPHEVLVIDLSEKAECNETVERVTGAHFATRIHAPQKTFSMSHGFNVGIKQATGDYIACIGFEMMLSVNYTETIQERAVPLAHLSGTCGFLGPDADLSDLTGRWDELIEPMEHNPVPGRKENTYRKTVGALQVMHRDQWHRLRGYNEEVPFARADSELIRAVRKARLKERIIIWEQAQMLHPHHKKASSLMKHIGGIVNLDAIRERNAKGWGEV